MKFFLRSLGMAVGLIIILIAAIVLEVFASRADLPDFNQVALFAPISPTLLSGACLSSPTEAIPYYALGPNLRGAMNAAEGGENSPGTLDAYFRQLSGNTPEGVPLSLQIARTLACNSKGTFLKREWKEIRTAIQLDRRFSKQQLLTIYSNCVPYEDNITGVQLAAQHYFHKNTNQLTIAEAALLAGMIRAPLYLSPTRHPDRAIDRRNELLDKMSVAGVITPAEAKRAKEEPLPRVM